jgi:hypothetical protein
LEKLKNPGKTSILPSAAQRLAVRSGIRRYGSPLPVVPILIQEELDYSVRFPKNAIGSEHYFLQSAGSL